MKKMSEHLVKTLKKIREEKLKTRPVKKGDLKRGVELISKEHPEWGTFVVQDAATNDGVWNIRGDLHGRTKGTTIGETEAIRFWEVVVVDQYGNKNESNPSNAAGKDTSKLHGYLTIYKGKKYEVWTDKGSYDAQKQAAEYFKVPKGKGYEVSVTLAVKPDGKEVIHTATE